MAGADVERSQTDDARRVEIEAIKQRMRESSDEPTRRLIEVHDRLIAMLDDMIEKQRRGRPKRDRANPGQP